MDKIVTTYGIMICSGGEGNSLTQSFPTVYHTFHSKIICKDEADAARWKKVTEAEAEALRAKDAEAEIPSEDLIANAEYRGAVYNLNTGCFELNGLVDLTAAEMREILFVSQTPSVYHAVSQPMPKIRFGKCRTILPILRSEWLDLYFINGSGGLNHTLEVLAFEDNNSYVSTFSQAFYGLWNLKRVIGTLRMKNNKAGYIGDYVSSLEEIRISNLQGDFSFSSAPKLSLDSIEFIIDNAENTSPITITLHADAYARLTDEIKAKAEEKNITLATKI